MAKLEVTIEGSAKGLSQAFNQAASAVSSATGKINKSLSTTKGELDAWDAAARRNSMERYNRDLMKVRPTLDQLRLAYSKLNGEVRLMSTQPSFSFGVGDNPNRLAGLTKNLKNVRTSYNGANGAAMEFSRIIQDAPYGIQGVANNIQQLGAQLGYASQRAGGFGKGLKLALRSLISPMGLVMIGISAVTVGWQLYSKHIQKAKKDTDDTKKSFDDFVKTLDSVRGAQVMGEANSQKQIADLRVLYNTTQDATIALDTRKKAVKELQRQFPSYFGQIKSEAILAGEATSAYNKLAKAILDTAQARAAQDEIINQSKGELRRRLEIEQETLLLNKAKERVAEEQKIVDEYNRQGKQSITAQQNLYRAQSERDKLLDSIQKKAEENSKSTELISRLSGEVTQNIKEGADVTLSFSDNIEKASKKAKKIKHTWEEIYNAISKSPFENALSDMRNLVSEVNKLKGVKDFDPFNQSAVMRRLPANTPDGAGVSLFQKAQVEWAEKGTKKANEFSRTISRAFDRAGRDFYQTMTNLNSLSDATFGGIFATITDGLNESMQEIFLGQMTDMLKKGISEGTSGLGGALGSQLNIALAGVGLLGGIISGLGNKNKPNYGAKIGGGALQGAASGAMIGSVIPGIGTAIGAVAGGIIGAIGGLFGGKKREKELRLQEEQLREQEKQTKILERQNALTYASSIIGKMVNGLGIIGGVDINEYGQLTAKVSGQDLQFVLDRANKSSNRGS